MAIILPRLFFETAPKILSGILPEIPTGVLLEFLPGTSSSEVSSGIYSCAAGVASEASIFNTLKSFCWILFIIIFGLSTGFQEFLMLIIQKIFLGILYLPEIL